MKFNLELSVSEEVDLELAMSHLLCRASKSSRNLGDEYVVADNVVLSKLQIDVLRKVCDSLVSQIYD